MPHFPPDMFDDPPADLQRVGAHRAPGHRGGGWVAFAWAALATGVLVAAGVVAVGLTSGSSPDAGANTVVDPSAGPSSLVTPVTDPRTLPTGRSVTITVLNGTSHVHLQNTAARALRSAHWAVDSLGDATSSGLTTTTVYYRDEADADVAEGVVETLGVGEAELDDSATFGATLEVALGEDYYAAQ